MEKRLGGVGLGGAEIVLDERSGPLFLSLRRRGRRAGDECVCFRKGMRRGERESGGKAGRE